VLIAEVQGFLQGRDLLWQWMARTLQARYQQSVLGWSWAVIQPVAQTAIFAIIFTRFVPVDTGETPYLVFSYAATVPWAFLATSLSDMANSLVDNMNLVNKIYFRRELLPIATMLARLIDLGVALLLFVALAVFYGVSFATPALPFLAVVILVQVLLVTGLGLVCAAGNVFVRDVRPLLVLVTQLWFYASPVIYPLDTVPPGLRSYYMLNPMAGIIEAYRSVLTRGRIPDSSFLIAAAVSVALFVIGYAAFKRVEFRLADLV